MQKALITGGAGFIGSHLAETLLDKGARVHVIDDLSTGSLRNIEHLKHNQDFSFTEGTVMDRALMARLMAETDAVYHLAAAVGVRLVVEQPLRAIHTNIKATEIVLELAEDRRTKVLIASTSEVYGKLDKHLFSEDDNLVLGPTSKARWCYAASKIVDEFLARAYFKERGVPTVVVRLFNTIGPRQTGQYGMVVPRFVRQALTAQPITVYGDGTQQRSFTWVGDAVRAMTALMDTSNAYGEVCNVGGNKEVSILELARMVKQMTHSKSEIVFVPYEQAYQQDFEDMPWRLPDISKVHRLTGYEPTLDLPQMLVRVITHIKNELESKVSR